MRINLRTVGCIATMLFAMTATAQNNGSIDAQMLKELAASYQPTGAEKALQHVALVQHLPDLGALAVDLDLLQSYRLVEQARRQVERLGDELVESLTRIVPTDHYLPHQRVPKILSPASPRPGTILNTGI